MKRLNPGQGEAKSKGQKPNRGGYARPHTPAASLPESQNHRRASVRARRDVGQARASPTQARARSGCVRRRPPGKRRPRPGQRPRAIRNKPQPKALLRVTATSCYSCVSCHRQQSRVKWLRIEMSIESLIALAVVAFVMLGIALYADKHRTEEKPKSGNNQLTKKELDWVRKSARLHESTVTGNNVDHDTK